MDAAALALSTVDVERDVQADICLRAGYLCLRRIADRFGVPHNPDPRPTDPISVTRGEWDDVVESLASQGVPMKPDRDQAWRDFAGWRVNYDTVLIELASLTTAPCAVVVGPLVRSAIPSADVRRRGDAPGLSGLRVGISRVVARKSRSEESQHAHAGDREQPA